MIYDYYDIQKNLENINDEDKNNIIKEILTYLDITESDDDYNKFLEYTFFNNKTLHDIMYNKRYNIINNLYIYNNYDKLLDCNHWGIEGFKKYINK